MAKGIAINGQLRGKIGGTVYYRAAGEQISRARNFHPNNPKTMPQMMQRLALANASKASKGLKEIINHSFEGIRYGVDSVRHFESKAQLALKAAFTGGATGDRYTAFVPLDALGFPVAEFLVSSGSLASADVTVSRDGETRAIKGFDVNAAAPAGTTASNITPRQFCELLGVNVDSQLTILLCKAEDSVGGAGSEVIFSDNLVDAIIRINFKPEALDEPMLENNKVKASALITAKSQNYDLFEVNVVDSAVEIFIDRDNSGAALIVSRYVDGQWRRSTEKLTIAAPIAEEGDDSLQDTWGWNWTDEVQKTIVKSKSAAEDRLLNKEENSDID